MRSLIATVLIGCLIPLAASGLAAPQAAPAQQKPPADAQAPVTPEQVRSAIDRLGDLDFPMRSAAARTSAAPTAAVAVPALIAAVKQHSDGYVRFRALVLLSGFNDPRTRDVMVAAVTDKNDRLRDRRLRLLRAQPRPRSSSRACSTPSRAKRRSSCVRP